ncbi:MAG: hypothetical protein C0501_27245 [Isosphaera sp.]|nr:hypothetical protein [Isosphaera sp.]
MRRRMRHAPRTSFRRAVAGSVAAHLLLAGVAAVVLTRRPSPPPAPAAIDTRADGITLRAAEVVFTVEPPPSAGPTEPDPPPSATPDPPPTARPQSAPSRLPPGTVVPGQLPGNVLAHIRRPAAPRPAPAAAPLHGAMKPGQVVVYVLDCSGSMGEFGKLAAAKAALAATLRRQPGEVRFQVVAYNSTARALLPGRAVPASAANVAAAEAALADLAAAGRSDHREGVRAAAALRPDVVILLTDADDLSAAALKPVLAGRPVCVARVTAAGAGPPRELR